MVRVRTGTFLRTLEIVFILTCAKASTLHLHVNHGLTLFSLRNRQPSCPFIERFISLGHGTSEQFHSEFKTDLDIEQLPSGKFATNALAGCNRRRLTDSGKIYATLMFSSFISGLSLLKSKCSEASSISIPTISSFGPKSIAISSVSRIVVTSVGTFLKEI